MITSAAALVAWIEAALPEADPAAFGPWLAEKPSPGALAAIVHIRIESTHQPPQSACVTLSAHPLTDNHTAP
ncbi:hypothetical protein [Nocardia sp. NPDC004123]